MASTNAVSRASAWTASIKAIKLALLRLWDDPENRREDGSLRVEPLICVHDELVTQWREEDDGWARSKMKEWFRNEVCIAGQRIVIPAEGWVGRNWGMKGMKEKLVEIKE